MKKNIEKVEKKGQEISLLDNKKQTPTNEGMTFEQIRRSFSSKGNDRGSFGQQNHNRLKI